MNSTIDIDERNLQATVQPGVINVFRNAVENKGLFYPPDPASKGSCFLGGIGKMQVQRHLAVMLQKIMR